MGRSKPAQYLEKNMTHMAPETQRRPKCVFSYVSPEPIMQFPQFTKAEREQTGSEAAGNSNSG